MEDSKVKTHKQKDKKERHLSFLSSFELITDFKNDDKVQTI